MPKIGHRSVVDRNKDPARARELKLQAGRGKPRSHARADCKDCHGLNGGVNRITGIYCHCMYDWR